MTKQISTPINLGLPTEADTALALGKTVDKPLGLPTETGTALGMTKLVSTQIFLGLPTETDTALALGKSVAIPLGLPTETDTALPVTKVVEAATFTFKMPAYEVGSTTSRPLFRHYKQLVADSLVRRNGVLTPYRTPPAALLVGEEGVDWFLGGRIYTIPKAVRDELVAAGYSVEE